MTPAQSPSEYENNPNYTVTKNDDGSTTVQAKAKTFKRATGSSPSSSTYVPEEYYYDSQGNFVRGVVRSTYQSAKRNYAVYDKYTYVQTPQGLEERVREPVGYKVRAMETNLITASGRQQISSQNNLTKLQKENQAKRAAAAKALQGRYIPKTTAAEKITPTKREEFIQSLLNKQGKKAAVSETDAGLVIDYGDKKTIEKGGYSVTVPQSATVDTSQFSAFTPKSREINLKSRNVVQEDKPAPIPEDEAFTAKLQAQAERDKAFFQGEGFKRIKDVGNILTQSPGSILTGNIRAYEQRTLPGKAAALTVSGIAGAPIFIGGAIPSFLGKLKLTGEALTKEEYRASVGAEAKRAAKETALIYDPRTPEGLSTYFSAAIFAFPIAVRAITPKSTVTVQSQSLVTKETGQGSVTIAKIQYNVKVGSKTYSVAAKGAEVARNVGVGSQKFRGAYQFESGNIQAIQGVTGARNVGPVYSKSISQAKTLIYKAAKGTPKKVTFRQSQTAAFSKTVIENQGLNEYQLASITRATNPKQFKVKSVAKNPPKFDPKYKPFSIEGGISKEVLKVNQVTATKAYLVEYAGKKNVATFNVLYDQAKNAKVVGVGREANVNNLGSTSKSSVGATSGSVAESLTQGAKIVAEAQYKQAIKVQSAPLVRYAPIAAPKNIQSTETVKPKSVVKTQQKSSQRLSGKGLQINKTYPESAVKEVAIIKSEPVSKARNKQSQELTTKSLVIQDAATTQKAGQEQAQALEQIQITQSNQRSQTSPRSSTPSPIVPPSTPQLIVPKISKKSSGGGLFETFVRRRGKFELIGRFPDEESAARTGAAIAQGTAAASFKVAKGGKPILGLGKFLDKATFRESRREEGVIIERRKSRINTPGELGEITFKGIFSRKSGKSPFKNIFGGK